MRCVVLILFLLVQLGAAAPLTLEELMLLRRVGVGDIELASMLRRHGLQSSAEVATLAKAADLAPELRDQLERFTVRRVEIEVLAAGYAEAAIGPFTTVAPAAWERSVFHQGSVECTVFTDAATAARLILAVLPPSAIPEEASLQVARSLVQAQRGAFTRARFRLAAAEVLNGDGRLWTRMDITSDVPEAPRVEGVLLAGVIAGQPVFIVADGGSLDRSVVLQHVTNAARALTLMPIIP